MSITKNFGLVGVGNDLQLGKGGGRLVFGSNTFKFTSDGTTLITAQTADPVAGADVATKAYVDSVAAGLDPKGSVAAASVGSNITLNGTQTVDGVSLTAGMRFLAKDQTDNTQNGIWVVAAGAWARSTDMDGTPASEISGGNFVFVEGGTANANSGWVLQGSGNIDVTTGPKIFVQFSGSGSFVAGAGLTKTGSTFDVGTASSSRIVVNTDNIDLATTAVTPTTYGNATTVATFTVDAYGRLTAAVGASIAIPSTAVTDFTEAAQDAVGAILSATGVGVDLVYNDAGNTITANLDYVGLTNEASLATGDVIAMYDLSATAYRGVTLGDLRTFAQSGINTSSISQLNSSVTVVDAGTGTITVTADGSAVATFAVAGVDVATAFVADNVTSQNLTSGRVVLASTGGALSDNSNLTFNGTTLAVVGNIAVDNLRLDGNILSATNTNGSVFIAPDGTGEVVISGVGTGKVASNIGQVLQLSGGVGNGAGGAAGNIVLRGGSTSDAGVGGNVIIYAGNSTSGTDGVTQLQDVNSNIVLEIQNTAAASTNYTAFVADNGGYPIIVSAGSGSNRGFEFSLAGTGVLKIIGPTAAAYAAAVTSGNDVTNKQYVDDAIAVAVAASAPSGAVLSVTATINLGTNGSQTIGTIPAGSTILRTLVKVTTAATGTTAVTVGDVARGDYMGTTENDLQANGLYLADSLIYHAAQQTAVANITNSTAGSATVIVEYRTA